MQIWTTSTYTNNRNNKIVINVGRLFIFQIYI
jgi:hypothetical protein